MIDDEIVQEVAAFINKEFDSSNKVFISLATLMMITIFKYLENNGYKVVKDDN